ncbi:MAG: hypothetical protein ACYCWC_12290 [Rhodocyclaceae bacterium]
MHESAACGAGRGAGSADAVWGGPKKRQDKKKKHRCDKEHPRRGNFYAKIRMADAASMKILGPGFPL